MRKNRDKVVNAMKPFIQRVVPDKREAHIKKEADKLMDEVIQKLSCFAKVGDVVIGASSHRGKSFIEGAGIISQEEEVRRQVASMTDSAIAEEMKHAAGDALTPEEIEALRLQRMADASKCPRCGMGPSSGRGYNKEIDRCQGCGWSGKRRAA